MPRMADRRRAPPPERAGCVSRRIGGRRLRAEAPDGGPARRRESDRTPLARPSTGRRLGSERPRPIPARPPPPRPNRRAQTPAGPAAAHCCRAGRPRPSTGAEAEPATPLRGAAGRIVVQHDRQPRACRPRPASGWCRPGCSRSTARILNNQLSRTGSAGKVSFTHLIGYAVVEALRADAGHELHFRGRRPQDDPKAAPSVIHHEHVGLGIAVDTREADGSRTLLVPVIKDADDLDFRGFWSAYEDLIRKVRTSKIGADDLAGATVTLTNPGTHRHGAVGAPAHARPGRHRRRRSHRLPGRVAGRRSQGAGRARRVQGGDHHLDLRPPDHPGRRVRAVPPAGAPAADGRGRRSTSGCSRPWASPTSRSATTGTSTTSPTARSVHTQKQIEVDNLINLYRVRGHLIAHLDPLDWTEPHMHPELDPATHGLSVWDLDREFLTNGLARHASACALGDILGRPAGRLLPDRRRRVHAHPGARPEALDPGARRRASPPS